MFFETVGIDLGTSYTRIYVKGQGVILSEPTVAAVEAENGKILCVGTEAEEMIGRTPKNVYAIRPLKNGVISDYRTTEKLLKYFMKKACGNRLFKPSAIICVPGGISQVSERAIFDAAIAAGIKNIELADVPVAAAMGAGADVTLPKGSLVVDIGAETCNVGVISMGSPVLTSVSKTAGTSFDNAICNYIKREKKIIIGEKTAMEIKRLIASVEDDEKTTVSRGRCILTGLPKSFEISSSEILPYMKKVAEEIATEVVSILEKTPPQLISDICEGKIILSGGGANLKGMAQLIENYTGIACSVAQSSENCVINGIGMFVEEDNKLQKNAL